MSWKDLEESNPALAQFGAERFSTEIAYLATIRKDGSPRVHPVTPIVGEGRLFLFMEPTSPKGYDLQRSKRFALHCAVSDTSGGNGEFLVSGEGFPIDDPETRALAVRLATYDPADRYVLFELKIDSAAATTYEDGQPRRVVWKRKE